MRTPISPEIANIRRENLIGIIGRFGSIVRLNEYMSRRKNDSVFSQIRNQSAMTDTRRRVMGTQLAREMENLLGLPLQWMDRPHVPADFLAINPAQPVQKLTRNATLENYVPIPVMELKPENGTIVFAPTTQPPKLYLRTDLPQGESWSGLVLCLCPTDSMAPLIPERALLLVDRQDFARKQILDSKLYLVRWYEDVRVARIRKDADGSYVFVYVNREFFSSRVQKADWGKVAEILGLVLQSSVCF